MNVPADTVCRRRGTDVLLPDLGARRLVEREDVVAGRHAKNTPLFAGPFAMYRGDALLPVNVPLKVGS
jgi:hypothetical protein